jgi:hypothetical protein
VTDDFAGQAPDLGALEVGRPIPRYGPGGNTDREDVRGKK